MSGHIYCTCNNIRSSKDKCKLCKCHYRKDKQLCDHCHSTDETKKLFKIIMTYKDNNNELTLLDNVYRVGSMKRTKELYDILLKLVSYLFDIGYVRYEDDMLISAIDLNHSLIPDNNQMCKNLKDNFYTILTAVIISPCANFDYNPETHTFKQRQDAFEYYFNQ